MSEEIKEILDIFTKYKDDWYSVKYILKPKQCVALYDYITNLQEENKRLNNIIDEAIKFIENYDWYYLELKKTLLDILKGDNK